jgi:hypothetical protein
MSAIQFLCPCCHLLMADDGRLAGRTAQCPYCGQAFIYPGNPSLVVVDGIVKLPNTLNYNIGIVGVTFTQHILESLCGGRSNESANVPCQALLTPEDDNVADRLAVRVNIDEHAVGHLSRGAARRWRSWLKRHNLAGAATQCSALIVGGWYRDPLNIAHFGVRLSLPLRDSAYD